MYPKIYFESKFISVLWSLIVIIPLLVSLLYWSNGKEEFLPILMGCIIVASLIGLFIYLYPVTKLALYENYFVYKKGHYIITSSWVDVVTISFQKNNIGDVINPSYFFIDTKSGATKLIDLKTLKSQSGKRINESEFINELEKLSGKDMMIGDLSIKRYYQTPFKNINVPIKITKNIHID